ncbi:MAG TPA: MdtA/MuxA family multidrug efflux RND transporter periplasmic adaptor subunit [Cellvibrio sp.]|nr:MdtA/MuxA family multidrug efflux RND transporter periplasmic adaptor subunit [Cellvibrio sp.]
MSSSSHKTKSHVLIYGALLTLIVALLAWFSWQKKPATADHPQSASAGNSKSPDKVPSGASRGAGAPTSVSAIAVSLRDLPIIQSGLGTVIPAASVTVHARVSGQLEKVFFQEGQQVNKGDLLAEIDSRPFRADLAQTEGQATRNRALLANAERDLQRFESLLPQNTISQQQIDAQKSLVAQYQGAVQTDEGASEKARLQLSFTRILAPINGRIGLRQVDPGNNVSPSDTNGIAVITTTSPIDVVFSLPEDGAPMIANKLRSAQQSAKFLAVEAWDKSNKQLIAQGKLLTLDNQIDPTTGTIKLKARFDNNDQQLFPNQFINVRLLLDTQQQATVIPNTAIQRGANGAFVYLVQQEESTGADGDAKNTQKTPASTVSVRPVKLGISDLEVTAITEGLRVGDLVVTQGTDRLREGAKVVVIAQPPAGAGSAAEKSTGQQQRQPLNSQKNLTANP